MFHIRVYGEFASWFLVIRKGVFSEDHIQQKSINQHKNIGLITTSEWEILHGRINWDMELEDTIRFVKEYRYFRADNLGLNIFDIGNKIASEYQPRRS